MQNQYTIINCMFLSFPAKDKSKNRMLEKAAPVCDEKSAVGERMRQY